jgi:hypothetical protein
MKENAEYPLSASAEGAGLSGGQPQNYQSLKDRLGSAVMSTREVGRVVSYTRVAAFTNSDKGRMLSPLIS